MGLVGRGVRLGCAAALLVVVGTAVLAPVTPRWLAGGAVVVLITSLWRPEWAALAALAAAPWGARLADVPVRATELLCAAFLIGWLVRLDRPLGLPAVPSRRALLPALVYGTLAVVSWSTVEPFRRPSSLDGTAGAWWRFLPADYLITAGRDSHTAATLQILLGIAVCFAVSSLAVRRRTFARPVLIVLAASGLAAAAATLVAVPVRYWISHDANELIRYFVSTRSRYSFHVTDVNAAGSHFLLSAFIALGLLVSTRRRGLGQIVVLAVTCVALWICGSRAAMAAGALLTMFWFSSRSLVRGGLRWPSVPPRVLALSASLALAALVLSPVVIGNAAAMSGSAQRSMSVREEFLATSVSMAATAPLFGVGVGTYYERSNAFMPPGIRALYGRENAHDYFLQTAAELGIVGLVAFLWWLGASLASLWPRLDRAGTPTPAMGLLAGCVAFLLTCVTGHPLLVVEVSIPFWAALGLTVSDTL